MRNEQRGIVTVCRYLRGAAIAATLALLGGCDYDPLAIFDEDPPAPETASQAAARARADEATATAKDAPPPDLRDVPARPSATSTQSTRDKVVEGLIADRQNARYTDEVIRLQGEGRRSTATSKSTDASVATASATPSAPVATPAAPAPSSAPESPAKPPVATNAVAPPPPPPPDETMAAPRVPAPVLPSPPAVRPQSPATPDRAVPSGQATAPSTRGAIVVDRSALDAIGAAGSGASVLAAGGEQVATIQFAHSSSRLDARDRAILRQVAAIQSQSGGNLVVVGHASSRTQQLDKVAHEVANLKMSMARANAVANALIDSGVSRDRVTVEAVSDGRPMYSESMPTGEAGNRRAEVYLVR